MSRYRLILSLFFLLAFRQFSASEMLGGEITWKCDGTGNFIFQLVLYRDCNGADIAGTPETIKVWNHGVITDIQVDFLSRASISPVCAEVNGSPVQLACGNGANAGNGPGAVEKITYQSLPISLSGIPPAEGWVFTYETTARSVSVSNIVNPTTTGMTIVAKMFQIASVQNSCLDSSPQFLETPNTIVCSGTPYQFIPAVQDPDLDSLSFKLVNALGAFSPLNYNGTTNPSSVSYLANYSGTSPTPSSSMNGLNSNFNIDSQTGEMTFNSVITGEFTVKFSVESYRNGRKIAEVEREMTIYVINCTEINTAPTVTSDLTNFELTAPAGTNINFNVFAFDPEFLQDGSAQQNSIEVSSIMLGSNVLSSSGCDLGPCATLNSVLPITGINGATANVTWNTDCSLLKNSFGNEFDTVAYTFVFKVSDNYCQVPKVRYQTVTIHLTTAIQITPTQISCIQTLANGDLQIFWDQVQNPNNDFAAYELHSVQAGLLATINNIATTSTVVPAVNAAHEFFVKTVSGSPCQIGVSSDTVKNMQLTLFNPNNGTAVLSWNPPFGPSVTTFPNNYEIYREYPAGTWTLIGTLPYGVNQFKDTIDICSAVLNYQVFLQDQKCTHTSSIDGELLKDDITPDIPEIFSVSLDTLTGLTTIFWNMNIQPDTYGYVIYFQNANDILVPLDTVFGINTTSYSFLSAANNGPMTFSVAAFDSCFTDVFPATYQTSAKSETHTTMFLQHEYDICSKTVHLEWTTYFGWETMRKFEIFGKELGKPWQSYGTTNTQFFDIPLEEFKNYVFVIQAKDSFSTHFSFSNTSSFFSFSPSVPAFNYTKVATVIDEQISIKHYVENIGGVSAIALERKNDSGVFEEIDRQDVVATNLQFIDDRVDVGDKSYTYQVRIIDSCGNPGAAGNQSTTILLKAETDQLNLRNFLSWSAYKGFKGSILYYNVYRGVEGVFGPLPQATLPPNQLFFEDTLIEDLNFNGRICYYVEAVESFNMYGFQEISRSNVVCPVFNPLIYIPNSFTPNEDEYNQGFKPVVNLFEVSAYQFTVLDRWGQVIFQSKNVNESWDGSIDLSGKPAPSGTYIYVLQLNDGNNQEIIRRGHVTLLR